MHLPDVPKAVCSCTDAHLWHASLAARQGSCWSMGLSSSLPPAVWLGMAMQARYCRPALDGMVSSLTSSQGQHARTELQDLRLSLVAMAGTPARMALRSRWPRTMR